MSEEVVNYGRTEESRPKEQEKVSAMASENNIAKAEALVKAMKEQNDRYEQLIQRNEAAKVESILSGRSEAGPKEVKEETPKEYKERILRGGK